MTELDRLMTIPAAPDNVRRLATLEGFISSYEELIKSCKTYKTAYEVLEIQYERVFGRRKYDNFLSFKVVYLRKKKALLKKNARHPKPFTKKPKILFLAACSITWLSTSPSLYVSRRQKAPIYMTKTATSTSTSCRQAARPFSAPTRPRFANRLLTC